MVELVALRTIFDVCAREAVYEVGEELRVPWRRQASAEKKLRFLLEDILAAAREWRRRESGRRGKVKGGVEG